MVGQGSGKGEAHSVRARLRYRFDTVFARGTFPVIVLLGFATLALVVSAAFVLTVVHVTIKVGDHESRGPLEALWSSALRTLDAGTMGQDEGWGFRVVALLVTLGGIFVVSTLIGLLTTGLGRTLDRLRKGRSAVLEHGHTLILGWSSKVPAVVRELALAQESEGRTCVVILSRKDRDEVEDALAGAVQRHQKMRIVVRSGDPSDLDDLAIVAPDRAKRIVAISPDTVEEGDASVIRTVLALKDPRWGDIGARAKVIAEFDDERLADSIAQLASDFVVPVVPTTMIARIAAHVCRSRGVSDVYQDLLDYAGHEIYVDRRPGAATTQRRRMSDCLLDYSRAAVIGFVDDTDRMHLAPPLDTEVPAGSRFVVVSEDDSTIESAGTGQISTTVAARALRDPLHSDRPRMLVLGWNELGIHLLDQLRGDGSDLSATIVAVDDDDDPDLDKYEKSKFAEWNVDWRREDIYRDDKLHEIAHAQRPERIVLLADHAGDPAKADAEVLMRLLQVRALDVVREMGPSIIIELRDAKDVQLASIAQADDLVVSDHLASVVIAQLAQTPELSQIYDQLFDPTGPDLTSTSIAELGVEPGQLFSDAIAACARNGKYAIAVRRRVGGDDSDRREPDDRAPAESLSELRYPTLGDALVAGDRVIAMSAVRRDVGVAEGAPA